MVRLQTPDAGRSNGAAPLEGPTGDAARKPFNVVDCDANRPVLHEVFATATEKYLKFTSRTRAMSIQNAGANTLWLSLDGERWHYLMSGTSVDGTKTAIEGIWYCTQTGTTRFIVSATPM